ncbi:MAG: hypothetical protein IMZ50_15585 [Candidatus Atribacteria bacterium]|nr:hypothetical protein [Candidatus Atribacteria bacterium]
MIVYESLAALVADLKRGAIEARQLTVVQDNDCSHIYYREPGKIYGGHSDGPPCIWEGRGYGDTDELWALVLPGAKITWC